MQSTAIKPPRGGQFLDDAQSLAAIVDLMPRDEREEYRSYGALSLESAFPNRKMVVYTLQAGRPVGIEVLTMGDIEMNREDGCVVRYSDMAGELSFGQVAQRYRNRDVFFQVPQNFVFKWKGKQTASGKVQFVPQYAVLVKTKSKEIHQCEGHTYCVTFNRFRERFPDLDIRY